MGILDSTKQGSLLDIPSLDSALSGIFNRKVKGGDYGNDFPDGLRIVEIVDGQERAKDAIVLKGNFMPNEAFKYGGEQHLTKDFYPGNPEPVVHILGAREDNVIFRGKFKTKRLRDANGLTGASSLRMAAREYSELVDGMRKRGNLVRVTLGEWKRYGFLEKAHFELMVLTEISYEIELCIVSEKSPTNCKLLKGQDQDVAKPNAELLAMAADQIAKYKNYPSTMPRSLSEFLNDQISTVAGAINLVTNFVDGIFSTAASVEASAARAVGLIKNARTKISVYQRQLGQLEYGLTSLGLGGGSNGRASVYRYEHAHHILGAMNAMQALALILAELQKRFEALARTVPFRRHLVRQGDSLQKLAMQYYSNSDLWTKIYEHNKLASTVLERGRVLEIPRP